MGGGYSGRTLIVASWGLPLLWKPAKYVIESDGDVESVESRTSLELLVKRERRRRSATRVLIFVTDTLIVAKPRGQCSDLASWKCDPSTFSDYKSLVEAVGRAVKEWIIKCSNSPALRELAESRDDSIGGLAVEVVHGSGSYVDSNGNYWKFTGFKGMATPMGVYKAHALIKIISEMIDLKPDKLVVDVSHGVNYTSASLLEAAKAAALAYAVAYRVNVEVEIVNAEPYPQPSLKSGVPKLRLHVVNRYTLNGSASEEGSRLVDTVALRVRELVTPFMGKVKSGKLSLVEVSSKVDRVRSEELRRRVACHMRRVNMLAKLGLAATSIALYSMPLAVMYLAADTSKTVSRSPLEDLIRVIRDVIDFSVESGVVDNVNLLVYPTIMLVSDAVEMSVYSAAILERIVNASTWVRDSLEEEGASLKELKEIVKYLGALYSAVAYTELDSINDCILGDSASRVKCFIDCREGGWPYNDCNIGGMNIRNLKAHAGLERNIVECRRDKDEIRMRYRRGCWKTLKKKLASPSF